MAACSPAGAIFTAGRQWRTGRIKATQHPGSWWPDWAAWIAPHGGGQADARTPGDGRLIPIEDAPGSYVKLKASD